MPIACPQMKGSYEFHGETKESQGYVSWENCLKCVSNKGSDREKLQIKCGCNAKTVTLDCIPI
jgi:hypothetical protein